MCPVIRSKYVYGRDVLFWDCRRSRQRCRGLIGSSHEQTKRPCHPIFDSVFGAQKSGPANFVFIARERNGASEALLLLLLRYFGHSADLYQSIEIPLSQLLRDANTPK